MFNHASVFLAAFPASPLDRDPPHCFCRCSEEVTSTVPLLWILDVHETQIRFVHQHPGHVELLGVRIISDRGTGQCMMVLRELAQQDSQGRFVRPSSDELAEAIGATGGVGTITGCIQTLRGNIVSRLQKAGHAIGRDDVIRHDEQGYYLADGIVVQHQARQAAKEAFPTTTAPDLSDRQQWVLEQLKVGIKIQRKALEDHFDVSDKSAKRDLSQLVKRGLIEFVRAGRHGYYRLGLR